MKRCLLTLTLPALLAAAPSPLIVGSVRDQFGVPIAGARITAGTTSAETDAQGTFALFSSGVATVRITCAYCKPIAVSVTPDEPIVALVHRYDAVAQQFPSDRDVTYVPYTRAESVASLRPFTMLENSSHPLPGPQISDRGLSSRGALVLDGGIPLYDVASNQSPFFAFPAYAVRQYAWRTRGDAFSYGDLAGGGTLIAQTHGDEPYDAIVAAGNSGAFRFAQSAQNAAWSASASRDPDDRRMRADANASIPLSVDDAFDLRAFAAQDRFAPGGQQLNTSVTGALAQYQSRRENLVDASISFNGGGYDGTSPAVSYSAKWSDVQAQAGVTTNTRVQFFASAGARASSGYYTTSSPFLPISAGAIAQSRIDVGAQTSGDRYGARLGIGAFDLHYSGGANGAHTSLDGGIVTPGFTSFYALDPHWTLQLDAGESFALPTILEAFVYPLDARSLAIDRNTFAAPTLSYGDLRRFRASLTAAAQRVSGLDSGTVRSAGVSMAWQIAPSLSMRAWLMHDDDRTTPYEAVYRFGVRPRPATVGSYWITYEAPGLRIDAIYRRDLLDYRVDPHFDASLSVPLSRTLRLFATTERRSGIRYAGIGVRVQTP